MGVRITVQSLWTKSAASTFLYEFTQPRIVIGRSRSADVQLPHAAVSVTHASIREQNAGYVLVDEGSTNGTRIDDVRVVAGRPKMLRNHSVVDLGGYRLTVDVGVAVAQSISARFTADYARRILSEQLEIEDAISLDTELIALQNSADQSVDLLPIPRETVSEPPPARESRPSRPRASTPGAQEATQPIKLGRSEMAVYALAALVVAASIIAMALLTRS
ncbi:MAG: FHA domain-containing protein [Polyangiales bacterium]